MVSQHLYVLALALGVSGFISYKTFQWVLYEEIGPGSAALFLGFAILVFFGINNYDFANRLIVQRESTEVEDNAFKVMKTELQKQMETTRLLAEAVRQAAESAHDLAVEADRKVRAAQETVRKSHESSEEVLSVTARATWEILMKEFLEIEGYLKRWEEKNGLRRGSEAAGSLTDLAQKLERFEPVVPEPIKNLYFDRQRKYEILKKIKESSESLASPLVEPGFHLPEPPKLPVNGTMREERASPEALQ